MSKIEEGLAEYSSVVPLYSTAFWVAWITIIYSGDCIVLPLGDAYATTATTFIISTLFLGITLVLSAVFVRWVKHLVYSKRAMYGVGFACALCTMGIAFAGALPVSVYYLCAALSGVTTAFISLKGLALYAEVDTKKSALSSCFSLMLGVLIYCLSTMSAMYFSAWVIALGAALLPLFAVFVAFVPSGVALPMEDDASAVMSRAFGRFAMFLAIMTLMASVVRGIYPRMIDMVEFSASRGQVAIALIVMVTMVCVLIARRQKSSSFGRLYYRLFVAAALMLMPLAFFKLDASMVGVISSVSNGLLCLVTWNFLARVSYRTGMSPIRVYGFGYGVVALTMTLGFVVGNSSFAGLPDPAVGQIVTVAMLVCLMLSLLIIRERDIRACMAPTQFMMEYGASAMEPSGDASVASAVGGAGMGDTVGTDGVGDGGIAGTDGVGMCGVSRTKASFKGDPCGQDASPNDESAGDTHGKQGRFMLKCARIAEDYGLSAREAEVFVLLAKNKEAKAIADELFISFNTARTHIRKIYGKLDVHSRRELMDLIEDYRV